MGADPGEGHSLHAVHNLAYNYTRSLGPVLSRFFTGLRDRQIVGIRATDGRVLCPPQEYDPVTGAELSEFVELADAGVVESWAWVNEPLENHPLDHPFAWALIRLDGADTPMLHAVDAGDETAMRTGMRVQARWADEPVGFMTDIAGFVPATTSGATA